MGEAQRECVMECRDGMARPWRDADSGSETVITRKAVARGRCNKTTRGEGSDTATTPRAQGYTLPTALWWDQLGKAKQHDKSSATRR